MSWLSKTWDKVENAAKKVASNPIASAGIGLLTGGLTGGLLAGAASNQYAKNILKSAERQRANAVAEQKRQEEQKNREEAEKRRKLLSEAYGNLYGLGRTQSLINTPFKTLLGE